MRFMTTAGLLLGCAAALVAPAALADVNVYTTREAGLMKPLIDAFTAKTGITVNTVFVKDGLPERVAAEGENSPADVLMTVDIGNLVDLVDKGVTAAGQIRGARRRDPREPPRPGRPLVRALAPRPRPLRRQGPRSLDVHLRAARRPEVEGQGLHPLGPAPLQHRAHRGLHRQARRREGRGTG